MKQEWKEKWVKALKSGDYQRTQGELRERPAMRRSFCPIGVLCDVAGANWNCAKSAYLGAY